MNTDFLKYIHAGMVLAIAFFASTNVSQAASYDVMFDNGFGVRYDNTTFRFIDFGGGRFRKNYSETNHGGQRLETIGDFTNFFNVIGPTASISNAGTEFSYTRATLTKYSPIQVEASFNFYDEGNHSELSWLRFQKAHNFPGINNGVTDMLSILQNDRDDGDLWYMVFRTDSWLQRSFDVRIASVELTYPNQQVGQVPTPSTIILLLTAIIGGSLVKRLRVSREQEIELSVN